MTDQATPSVRTWTAAITGSIALWNAVVAVLDNVMEDFRAGEIGTYYRPGEQPQPTTPVLYRATAKVDLLLRDLSGNQLAGKVSAGDVVNVYREVASVGPNSAGRIYTERAVVNSDSGANVAAGATYLTRL